MTIMLLYWILMLLWIVFGAWSNWPYRSNVRPLVGNLLIFVLFLILGWHVFGAPIH